MWDRSHASYFFGGGGSGNPLGKLPFGTQENNCKMELTAWRGILLLQPVPVQLAKKFSQVLLNIRFLRTYMYDGRKFPPVECIRKHMNSTHIFTPRFSNVLINNVLFTSGSSISGLAN